MIWSSLSNFRSKHSNFGRLLILEESGEDWSGAGL